jgi:D-arabinose 1-dehydrogenase-like Zn-dependent alcohol dehydrogenase
MKGTRTDRWLWRRLRRRARWVGDDRAIAEDLGRRRTCQLIGASLSHSGIMLDPLLLTGRGITVGAISVGSRADFEAMNRVIALHGLRPVIYRSFPFAEAKEAYRHFRGTRPSRQGRDLARLSN